MKKPAKSERQKLLARAPKAARNRERATDKLSGKPLIRPLAKIRVLIVYQASWIRRATRSLIDKNKRFAVCAETDNARSAIVLFEQHQPKIVVMDLVLAHGDGLQLIKTLLKLAPAALILVLSWDGSAMSICRALRAGALGYFTVDLELPIASIRLPLGLITSAKTCGASF
jgi:PleD family two-component response regulator